MRFFLFYFFLSRGKTILQTKQYEIHNKGLGNIFAKNMYSCKVCAKFPVSFFPQSHQSPYTCLSTFFLWSIYTFLSNYSTHFHMMFKCCLLQAVFTLVTKPFEHQECGYILISSFIRPVGVLLTLKLLKKTLQPYNIQLIITHKFQVGKQQQDCIQGGTLVLTSDNSRKSVSVLSHSFLPLQRANVGFGVFIQPLRYARMKL